MSVSITLVHGSDREARSRDQLLALLSRYDLQPWQWTNAVVIDQDTIPHSHPVLTLHTRHLDNDNLLLSTYVHEQLHWFISKQPDERVEPAITALMERYPHAPVGYPEGAQDALSSYFHYLICYLEYMSVRGVLGEDEARGVMEFWQGDHYTAIYTTVMEDLDAIGEIAHRYDLIPAGITR